MPSTLRVRPARPEDHPLLAAWYPELASGDEAPPRERWRTEQMARTTICEVDGRPAGFCHAEVLEGEGYVRQVVTDPTLRRRGAGRALLGDLAGRLVAGGCRRWRLNVKPDNAPAIALYESLGLTPVHEGVAMDFPWTWIDGLCTTPTGATVREPEPAEFASLEHTLDLPPGILAPRADMATVRIRVIEDGEPRGLAAFDTAFPGSFPFRAASFPVAIDLLRALRPLATTPRMRVVIEGAPEVDEAFVAAGATPHLRFLHMVGEVPTRAVP